MSGFLIGPCGVAPPVSAAFSPSGLTGLIGWYDAQFSGGVLNTGSGVQATNGQAANTFVDRSGAGNDLTEPTQPPTFFSAGLTGSKPSVTFSAASNTFLSKSSYGIGTGSTLSIFTVCQLTSGAGAFSRLLSYAKSGAAASNDNVGSAIFFIRDAANNAIAEWSNSVESATSAISLATTIRLGVIYDGANITVYVNGSVLAATKVQTNTPWVTAGLIRLGSDAIAAAGPWDGPVGELIISTANLGLSNGGTNQVAAIDGYLAGRW